MWATCFENSLGRRSNLLPSLWSTVDMHPFWERAVGVTSIVPCMPMIRAFNLMFSHLGLWRSCIIVLEYPKQILNFCLTLSPSRCVMVKLVLLKAWLSSSLEPQVPLRGTYSFSYCGELCRTFWGKAILVFGILVKIVKLADTRKQWRYLANLW